MIDKQKLINWLVEKNLDNIEKLNEPQSQFFEDIHHGEMNAYDVLIAKIKKGTFDRKGDE